MPFFESEDRVKLYYELYGEGEPIIFIHGLTANNRHFKYQIRGLKNKFRIIVYDLRGHGASEVSDHNLNITRLAYDLREFMDHLDLSSVSLVGWSMGTHVIFEYIKQFGYDNIKKFCIIDMSPKLMKSDSFQNSECWKYGLRGLSGKFGDFGYKDNTQTLAAMATSNWKEFSKRLVERLYDKSLTKNGIFNYAAAFKGKSDIDWLYDQAIQNKSYVIITMWASMSVQDYRNLLKTIHIPVLITYGEGSNYYARENSNYMHSELKNSFIVPFSGCGHALHIQDYVKFNKVLTKFMQNLGVPSQT